VRGGEAAWSPDGRKLAFARKVRQEPEPEVDEIFVVNVDGSRERQLTRFGLISHHPSWSADGRKIVFVSNEPHRLEGTSIWVMSASGGGAHRITRARYEDADPDWHP
jgi:TolB protein